MMRVSGVVPGTFSLLKKDLLAILSHLLANLAV